MTANFDAVFPYSACDMMSLTAIDKLNKSKVLRDLGVENCICNKCLSLIKVISLKLFYYQTFFETWYN